MTAIVDTTEEADALDRPPLLVRRPLEALLDAHGLGSGPIDAEPVGEGHSNVTYLVRRGDAELVLRRPPRPPLPPSAHDVLREARLLPRSSDADVRTPAGPARLRRRVGDRRAVLRHGAHRGRRDRQRPAAALDAEDERRRIGEELVDALVEVHAVDWEACGLEGYGKPTGYLERQLRRFGGLWEHNKTRELPVLDDLDHLAGRAPPGVGPGHDRARRLPARQRDVRPRHAGAAELDLRLGAGHDRRPARRRRLPDRHLGPGRRRRDPFAALGGLTRGAGFPTRDELVARYEAGSGRSMSDVRWYMTLALWKSAIFLEGSYKRRLAGTTDDTFFDLLEQGVPDVAERARRRIAQGSGA